MKTLATRLKLKKNVGTVDRLLRLGLSGGLVYLGFYSNLISDSIAGSLLGICGVVVLASSIVGYCPFYAIAKLSTEDSKDCS